MKRHGITLKLLIVIAIAIISILLFITLNNNSNKKLNNGKVAIKNEGENPDLSNYTTIEFEDQNLCNAIIDVLGDTLYSYNSQDKIVVIANDELEGITELDLRSKSITNLSGIEEFYNLTDIMLFSNNITDVSPLKNLAQLESLNMDFNKLNDSSIKDLSEITSLKYLALDANSDITSIIPLANLTELESLYISYINLNNNMADIVEQVAQLTKLEALGLNHNNITDISDLSELKNLTVLQLNYNDITDISAVTEMNDLWDLEIGDNKIADMSAVNNLQELDNGIFSATNQNLTTKIATETEEIPLPAVFKQSRTSTSKIYTNQGLGLENCTVNLNAGENGTINIPLENETATVTINGGIADGTTFTITRTEEPSPVEKYIVTWRNYNNDLIKADEVDAGTIPEYIGTAPTKILTDSGYTYDFIGWIAKDGTEYNSNDVLPAVTKNVTYTANYDETAIEYTITYNYGLSDGENLETEPENPTTYTIETDTFTLINPTREGYTFAGWTGTGLNQATQTVTIEKGSTGNREYTATWIRDQQTGEIFDLSLRTYIKAINGNPVEDSRVPVVNTQNLNELDQETGRVVTTAEYKHRKDPVEVKPGDIVTYRLAVYNEGDIEGYVYSITDYIPEGLEFVPGDEFISKAEGAEYRNLLDNDPNTELTDEENALIEKVENAVYIYEFDSEERSLRIDDITSLWVQEGNYPKLFSLNAFDGETLDSNFVELKFKVTANVTNKDQVLTNVATMSSYDSRGGTADIIQILDRDSSADNITIPTAEELPEYKGNNNNKDDLTDAGYHYAGQQDDDDFEKVLITQTPIEPETKVLTGITITKQPEKVNYIEGENFDSEGMEVTATYSDESTEDVTESVVITGGESLSIGATVTVSYTEGEITREASPAITVVERVLTGIVITTPPTKVEYEVGKDFNPEGMVVKAIYNNNENTATEITGYTIIGGENLTLGTTSVTISYTEGEINKTAEQTITVTESTIITTTYTVTFVDEDGTVLKPATEYEYGTLAADIVKPADPEKAATAEFTYAFAGWSPAVVDVTGNATYTATYSETKRKYTVTFVDEDGTVLKPATEYEYGTLAADIVKPADPIKVEDAQYTYKFIGWNPEISSVTKDVVYKAKYIAIDKNILKSEITIGIEKEDEIEYIVNILPGTTVEEIKDNFKEEYEVKVWQENEEVRDAEIIKTNMKIKVVKDQTLVKEYILVVKGDCNETGTVSVADLTRLMMSVVESLATSKDEEKILTGAFKMAVDLNDDNKLNASDITLLSKCIAENK